ncbi:hypothetical protein GCM10025298_23760 [Natronobiforma cellulositropha]
MLGVGVLVLVFGMVAVLVSGTPVAASAPDCTEVGFAQNGDGVYEVANLDQLQCIGDDDHGPGLDADYLLVSDIDASATEGWNGGDGFEPIGEFPDEFTGTFDGDGFVISNLVIDRDDEHRVGLFGRTDGATIENVGLVDVDVTGYVYVGSLVGSHNSGTISASYTTGNVTADQYVGGFVGAHGNGGTISASYATSDVTADGYVGGFAGTFHGGVIEESYATGTVDGSSGRVGGLVGQFSLGSIETSYATGDVNGPDRVGGLVGHHLGGTIETSYATGDVNGSDRVGGLVGDHWDGTVTDSYWDSEAGLDEAEDESGAGTPLSTAEMTGDDLEESFAADFGLDNGDDTWETVSEDDADASADSYPILGALERQTQLEAFGVDEFESVRDWYDLDGVRDDLEAHYVLVNDLGENTLGYDAVVADLDGGFEPIGECQDNQGGECQDSPFEGTFDGNGYTISNLVVDSDEDQVGLFGGTDRAEITNVHLESADISGGIFDTGGLVGYAVFTDVSDVSVQGSVSGHTAVGGVVGYGMGVSITNATLEIGVSGRSVVGGAVGEIHSGTVAKTTVSGDSSASFHTHGGIVGSSAGTITESVSHVDLDGGTDLGGVVGVNEGTVENSYATGSVDGSNDGGGLVGSNDGGTVSDSYWDTQTTGQSDSDGGTGFTTYEMTGDRATDAMDGFDFADTWTVAADDPDDGYTIFYPVLQANQQMPGPSASLYADGDGEGAPYRIETWYHLENVRENLDANFVLATDLDEDTPGYDAVAGENANGEKGFDPIGAGNAASTEFAGVFDGDGHVIETLTIDRPGESFVGLFSGIGGPDQEGEVRDVGLVNAAIVGGAGTGGIVGSNYGTVVRSYVTGDVRGGQQVGGLVGTNGYGALVSDSYALADVRGDGSVGGLVGDNIASTGSEPDGTIERSYATGEVNEGDTAGSVGGLVGTNNGEVTDSYWDTQTTGQPDSSGGTGLETAQMTRVNATEYVAGFAFTDTWHATDAYPALAWEDTGPVYSVAITETNSPIEAGESLEVTVTVTNWAAAGVDRTIELRDTDFDDEVRDTEAVTLGSGDSTDVTLVWESTGADVGTGIVTVSSASDTASETVEVVDPEQESSTSDGSSRGSVDGDVRSVRIIGSDISALVTPRRHAETGASTATLYVTAGANSTIELRFDGGLTTNADRGDGSGATLERITMEPVDELDGSITISQQPTLEGLSSNTAGLDATTSSRALAYLSVETTFGDALDSATFEVTVPTDAIGEHEGPTGVTVYHYDGGWTALETDLVDTRPDEYVFEATSDGFSAFAIGLDEGTGSSLENGSAGDDEADRDDDSASETAGDDERDQAADGTPGIGAAGTALILLATAALLALARGRSAPNASAPSGDDRSP